LRPAQIAKKSQSYLDRLKHGRRLNTKTSLAELASKLTSQRNYYRAVKRALPYVEVPSTDGLVTHLPRNWMPWYMNNDPATMDSIKR